MDITVQEEIRPFLNYLQFEKRYSVHTIQAYQDDLAQFFAFIQSTYGKIALPEVSSGLIRSWLASLKEQKLSSKSIIRKISTLKSFFRYTVKVGLLKHTPMVTITSPKVNKRLPVFIDEKDIGTLLNAVEFSDDWKGKTARLIIHIFYNTGVRLSELMNLKETQISQSAIKVTGKGNKERMIPISKNLFSLIKEYADMKNEIELCDRTYLLVTEKGRKLYPKYLYLIVNEYLGKVTTVSKKSPHVLRHTFATHLTNNGADLNSVKELLGHSSLAATQIYTHNTIEKLKEAYNKAHPKA